MYSKDGIDGIQTIHKLMTVTSNIQKYKIIVLTKKAAKSTLHSLSVIPCVKIPILLI